jgi:hypothetical protein
LSKHFKTIEYGHHHVEEHEIELSFKCAGQTTDSIMGRLDRQIILSEEVTDEATQIDIVVDQQYSFLFRSCGHGRTSVLTQLDPLRVSS